MHVTSTYTGFTKLDTSRAIAERSKACVCSGFVVGVPSSNLAWGHFFLNRKKFVVRELDGELS